MGGNNPSPGAYSGSRTVVVREVNTMVVLPSEARVTPIYSTKLTVRWDISDYFAAVAELYYNRDLNRYTFRDSADGVSQATQEKPDILGFNTLLQARF